MNNGFFKELSKSFNESHIAFMILGFFVCLCFVGLIVKNEPPLLATANAAPNQVVESETCIHSETSFSSPLIGRTVKFNTWSEEIEGKVMLVGFNEGGEFTLLVLKKDSTLCAVNVSNNGNVRVVK
jgi:hypothetical protein